MDGEEHQKELSEAERRLREKILRDLTFEIREELLHPATVEVSVNPDGTVWSERQGEKMRKIGRISPACAEAVVRAVAAALGVTVTRHNPIVEGELPIDGSRFAGQIPPVVSCAAFSIRKKAVAVYSLSDYVRDGIMSEEQAQFIRRAVERHKNVVVSGGTGSGKTTLLNAIIREIDPDERLVVIEDTIELQVVSPNYVPLRTSVSVDMTKLLRTSLRMRPDRILVGEVRGPEALDLLMALNTGHEGGVCTIHANNARATLDRLTMLVSMNRDAPRAIEPLIAQAVDIVIHISKTSQGRRVREMIEVGGYDNGHYQIQKIGD
jgi:type IV secretion system protein VirB11